MLALVGSGEYLPPMERVDRFLLNQLKSEARVVCLPTAAGTEGKERIDYWSELGKAHFTRLSAEVEALPVIDGPSANSPEYAKIIQQSNFVYLSGGKPDYLYRTLSGSLVWEAIIDVLNRGGIVAGCSAGAMIMGEHMPGFPGLKPGFGLLKDVFIMPHFDEIPSAVTGTLRALVGKNRTLIGIEGNTALIGFDKDWKVAGSKGVVVWTTKEKRRYTHGEPVNWE